MQRWQSMGSAPDALRPAGWQFAEPAPGVLLRAEPDGLSIQLPGEGWSAGAGPATRLGRLLPDLLPQLVGMEAAERAGDDYRIVYPALVALPERGIDAFDELAPWVPWPLEIESSGNPGGSDFDCKYRFYSGEGAVYPERRGCFLQLAGRMVRLDASSFALIEAIDAFRGLPGNERAGASGLIRLAEIKGLAEDVGAELDRFWRRERIVVPERVGVRVMDEAGGRVSLAPTIGSVDPDVLATAAFALNEVPAVMSLGDHGERVRIVLNEAQREAVRRMQRARHTNGVEKAELLRNPAALFDGIGDVVEYGPRVVGVGDFPFKTELYREGSTSGALDPVAGVGQLPAAQPRCGIRATYADGTVERVPFRTAGDARKFCERVHEARRSGSGVVDWDGKSIVVDAALTAAAEELAQSLAAPRMPASGKYLLMSRNDGSLEYQESAGAGFGALAPQLPRSLRDEVQLKAHQLEGLAWLQQAFRAGRRGCLLADDMGLGKTLQTLCFIAWLIERGDTKVGADADLPPWKPALVIAPLTLIEMEVWRADMRKFFRNEGAVFQPWVCLRGRELERARGAAGAELEAGTPRLDGAKLQEYRVVLTNYETVVRYQHSFAAMRDHWSVVVTDEAQRGKTPDTRISHALKGLAPGFRIACTGTPVETRLLDLWNIMDYLQPGALFDSAKAFERQYVVPAGAPESDYQGAVARLRGRLQLGQPDAFLLRREKTQLRELPTKFDHVLDCELSGKQREEHLSLLAAAVLGSVHPFALLQGLMNITQHPALMGAYEPLVAAVLIEQCPRLQVVLDTLAKIQVRGEKALLFTRSLNMQQILHAALQHRFGIDAGIINGESTRSGTTTSLRRTRSDILTAFTSAPGFDALILSPDVAGFGLNLVAANHVIHYGRWWNPAKEAQATDRVYRLGQKRDVHVYIPIARDPLGEFRTFDEKLDGLLRRRRALATDFLHPAAADGEIEAELFNQFLGGAAPSGGTGSQVTIEDVQRMAWDSFEALVSLLERKQGAQCLLTPGTGDDKADVIAAMGTEVRLIQCKHTSVGAVIEEDALREVLNALDIYRRRHLRDLQDRFTLRPVVSTNSRFAGRARRLGQEREIELRTGEDIEASLRRTPCTWAELEMEKSRRLPSMQVLRAEIGKLTEAGRI